MDYEKDKLTTAGGDAAAAEELRSIQAWLTEAVPRGRALADPAKASDREAARHLTLAGAYLEMAVGLLGL